MSGRELTRLKDLLGPVGKALRLDDAASIGRLWRTWPDIVGEEIARHAEPSSLKAGVLRIRTTTPVWATEISYLVEEIKQRVNTALAKPLVKEIRVWTSPEPIKPRRSDAEHDRGRASPVHKKASSDDPESAFRRAFEAWSKRRSKGPR